MHNLIKPEIAPLNEILARINLPHTRIDGIFRVPPSLTPQGQINIQKTLFVNNKHFLSPVH